MSTAAVTSTNIAPGISDERIARRIAVLLAERRRQSGMSLRSVAKASGGRFTARQLKSIESARSPLSREDAHAVARLYGIDLAVVTPDRLPLEIDARGVVSTGGSAISFDPDDVDSLLTNYLRLVRSLRGQERPQAIELRRNDVEVLALYLEMPGEHVVERLAALMGATQLQRRVLAGMFVAGAMVIGLSAAASANLQAAEHSNTTDRPSPPSTLTVDWRD
jgi:transcriptional regulator with XRE-family HTH domain